MISSDIVGFNVNLNELFLNSAPPHKIIHYRDYIEYKYCILKQHFIDNNIVSD